VLASMVPNCVSYDPAYSYEVAVIVQNGLQRMIGDQEDVFFYLTLMNENYEHPALPEGAEPGILRGMYLLRSGGFGAGPVVQLLGSGTILREVLAGADLLLADYSVAADVWSATSFTELRRDGIAAERWNMLHPGSAPRRNLRRFFEVDRHYVAVAALASLAEEGVVPAATVGDAIARYGIDPDKPEPWLV